MRPAISDAAGPISEPLDMRKTLIALACAGGLLTVSQAAFAFESTAVGVGSGVLAGAVVAGPVGAVVGGITGGYIGSRYERPRYYRRPVRRARYYRRPAYYR